ncbi:MAG: endonuclease/exonuclease/phosphatase family protein [bacterium]|nr:endonuclease/exonuclease/phosphatase family protein [bacterium]
MYTRRRFHALFLAALACATFSTPLTTGQGNLRIYDIQGARHHALNDGGVPFGTQVTNIEGIVTGYLQVEYANDQGRRDRYGFFMQDPAGDGDPATSDGIFVFTSTTDARDTVNMGDLVAVDGRVTEFGQPPNLTVTQIVNPAIRILSRDNPLPAPIQIGPGEACGSETRLAPTEIYDDDGLSQYQPGQDALDFYESLEGMRVCLADAHLLGDARRFSDGTAAIWVLPGDGAAATGLNQRGGLTIQPDDFNPERVQIDSNMLRLMDGTTFPDVSVAQRFDGTITGVWYYSFGSYELVASEALPPLVGAPPPREITSLIGSGTDYTIATYNVENLDPSDDTFTGHAETIVNALQSPDIVMLQEMQDNNGAVSDGVTAADQTFTRLIDAIRAAGGVEYAYAQIDPEFNQDGGEGGGNIRTGYLYNPVRVQLASGAVGGARDAVGVTCDAGSVGLGLAVGRIAPLDSAFNASRKPLAAQFIVEGDQSLFVINNHWVSKGGDNPLFGANQPPALPSERTRLEQARIVRDFVQALYACDPDAFVIVAGDLNDFWFAPPVTTLEEAPLITASTALIAQPLERYSYIFEGNAQTLDQILYSPAVDVLLSPQYDIVHINAGYADQLSDHDPSVLQLQFGS